MSTNQRFGSDKPENRKDRREPAIELDEEPAIVIRKGGPAPHLASQDGRLMSKHCILCLEPAVYTENLIRVDEVMESRKLLSVILTILTSPLKSKSRLEVPKAPSPTPSTDRSGREVIPTASVWS